MHRGCYGLYTGWRCGVDALYTGTDVCFTPSNAHHQQLQVPAGKDDESQQRASHLAGSTSSVARCCCGFRTVMPQPMQAHTLCDRCADSGVVQAQAGDTQAARSWWLSAFPLLGVKNHHEQQTCKLQDQQQLVREGQVSPAVD